MAHELFHQSYSVSLLSCAPNLPPSFSSHASLADRTSSTTSPLPRLATLSGTHSADQLMWLSQPGLAELGHRDPGWPNSNCWPTLRAGALSGFSCLKLGLVQATKEMRVSEQPLRSPPRCRRGGNIGQGTAGPEMRVQPTFPIGHQTCNRWNTNVSPLLRLGQPWSTTHSVTQHACMHSFILYLTSPCVGVGRHIAIWQT